MRKKVTTNKYLDAVQFANEPVVSFRSVTVTRGAGMNAYTVSMLVAYEKQPDQDADDQSHLVGHYFIRYDDAEGWRHDDLLFTDNSPITDEAISAWLDQLVAAYEDSIYVQQVVFGVVA